MRNMKTKLLRKIRERFLYEWVTNYLRVMDLQYRSVNYYKNIDAFMNDIFCSGNKIYIDFGAHYSFYQKNRRKKMDKIKNKEWNKQLKGYYQRAQQIKANPSIMQNKIYIPKEYKAVSRIVTYSEHLQEQHEKQQSEITELKARISELENAKQ